MDEKILKIQNEVFARRPMLKEIIGQFSDFSLKEYVQKHWELPQGTADVRFLGVLRDELTAVYGYKIAQEAYSQIKTKPLVSTVDHQGLWGHPIFVNSDLIYSLYFKSNELPIVLATESVSLNNTSSWSASWLWHSQDLKMHRLSFLPDRLKTLPAFCAPAIGKKDVSRFNKASQDLFKDLIGRLGLAEPVEAGNFSIQASQVSHKFWQAVFPEAPKLLYLPLETLIAKYLLLILREDEGNFITRLILTQAGRRLWSKYFSQDHTFMFWAIDAKGRRKSIKSLPAEKEEIIGLIKGRKIYPAGPLCFVVLLKAGLACAGGFNQTTWLTEIKAKLIGLLSEFKMPQASIQTVPTKNFAESSLAWIKLENRYVAPTALDLHMSGFEYYPKFAKLAEKITLGQSLHLAMPTIYSVVAPKAQWHAGFELEKFQNMLLDDPWVRNILDACL